ncbi:hypothetical protein Tco_1360172 [Tanacetum coccineum]
MYTCLVEFANFRVPLSKFLLCALEYYQINLAQLFVIGAAKVSHFELICRVLGRVPTVGTFRRFYVNSISNGWLSFSKRSGAAIPCCYSKNLDSLKKWNNCFFWIDASVCPLSIPWFNGTSVVKDPLPLDDAVDLPCVELLNENQMGLLDFVKSADPFKVKIGERTLVDNEVPLLEETEDRKVRTDGVKISEPVYTTAEEKYSSDTPAKLARAKLNKRSEDADLSKDMSAQAVHINLPQHLASSVGPGIPIYPKKKTEEGMVDSQPMEEEIRGTEARYVGTETREGPTEPVLQTQKTPSPSPDFIKENIDMLRTMIKEHDQKAKTKATPRRLTYANSDEEAPAKSLARSFSDRFSLESSAHPTLADKLVPPAKVRRPFPRTSNRHT